MRTERYLCIFGVLFSSILYPIESKSNDIQNIDVIEKQYTGFRDYSSEDVFTGISVIDVEELIEKDYSASSIPDLKSLIGGLAGGGFWGQNSYLLLVDGMPRESADITLSEISKIVVMKGASAVVLHGSRAVNGVINLITKRGNYDKKLNITARGTTGVFVPKSYPRYLGSAEYMSLYNEACVNDGLSPIYDNKDIYYTSIDYNPYKYPNLDYYSDDYLKKAYNKSNASLEIQGGTDKSKFYTNIGYSRQGSLYKLGNAANSYNDRLNVRGNLDMNLSKMVSAFANVSVVFTNNRQPRFQANNFWTESAIMRPNQFTPFIPIDELEGQNTSSIKVKNVYDGFFLAGNQINMTNSLADMYAAGYQKNTSRLFQFNTGVDLNLDKITKGLSFHFMFGVDYNTAYRTSINNTYTVYNPFWVKIGSEYKIGSLESYGTDKETSALALSNSSSNQTVAMNAYLDYKRVLKNKHNLSAMIMVNGYQQTLSGLYHKISNANIGFQLGYDYHKKYFIDFSAAVVGSAKFSGANRFAFSPSMTLGWNLKNEEFLRDIKSINKLQIGLSASQLNQDIDITDYYLYSQNIDNSSLNFSWNDGSSSEIAYFKNGGNKNLTYVGRKELSANLKAELFDRLLSANINLFYTSVEGLPVEAKSTVPSYFYFSGAFESSFGYMNNYNNNSYTGFDYEINLNKKIGEIEANLGLVGIYYRTKATRRDELNQYDYQNMTGRELNLIKGYECLGFFSSEQDVLDSKQQLLGGDIKPGDLKYKDQNNDGVINSDDMVYLESRNSPYHFGLNFDLKWKDFELYLAGSGKVGGYEVKSGSYFWVYGDGKYSEVVRDRWTEQTAATAKYPRLTTLSGNNNFVNSSFWLYKTDQFNLHRIQLTYNLPKKYISHTKLNEFSVYIGGSNLLTLGKEKEILELNVGSAPQNRYYDLGVKLTF